MADIFLSYASQDLERVKPLAAALKAQGWSVFYDRTIPPGKSWRQVIGKEIEECRCMVVCWSAHAIQSRWVLEEADISLERQILIPLFLDAVKPPFGFGSIQGANLVDWHNNTDSTGYLALCDAIFELIGAGNHPITEITVPTLAQTKTTSSKQPSFVLPEPLKTKIAYIEPEMVEIPAGRFQMGGDFNDNEKPVHTVTFTKPFSIAKNLVTFDQYDLFAQANKRPLPDDESWGRGQRPAINVSWKNATEYASWLSNLTGKSYRLPSEAEWEYAARANATSEYYWDGLGEAKDFAWYYDNSEGKTHPVGELKPNAFGLYDMSGNVCEWLQDCWHDNYQNAPIDGSAWESKRCDRRVLRGGSWSSLQAFLRSALRSGYLPDYRSTPLASVSPRTNPLFFALLPFSFLFFLF